MPLAERMRPQSLADIVGQEHILGANKWLRAAIDANDMSSVVLWGPPGCGKTTLGRVIAKEVRARFIGLSAVEASVKDIRFVVEQAKQELHQYSRQTILFLDEIHRFSKSQQDSLLPHVESGVLLLVGATTENPSFHINSALLSRLRVLPLRSLSKDDLRVIIRRAVEDKERGIVQNAILTEDAINALLRHCQGDARRLLGLLQSSLILAKDSALSAEHVTEAAAHKTLLFDKTGDEHYGVISALIKSMRGSDPDAAVYWTVRLLESGEDPLFIARRLVVFASEDIGNADPRALAVALSAKDAAHFVGMPEAKFAFAQAAVYLACAPKSNEALLSYGRAKQLLDQHGPLPVPNKLRPKASSAGKALGWGEKYNYPHDNKGQYRQESYLPEDIQKEKIYGWPQSEAETVTWRKGKEGASSVVSCVED